MKIQRTYFLFALALGAGAGAATGCELIASVDHGLLENTGGGSTTATGTGGTGGTGGGTTTPTPATAGGGGQGGTGGGADCGNGAVDTGEDCDGADLGGADCVSQGFVGGTLSCNASCQFDTAACTNCGNDTKEGTEVCDGTDVGTDDCTTIGQGFIGGTLACAAGCGAFDTSGCTAPPNCGNGNIDGAEDCDGANLNGKNCDTATGGTLTQGTLACTGGCVFDTSGCSSCGNDTQEGSEICDGTDLDMKTCATEGFVSGTLACGALCDKFDTSGCSSCGNDNVDPGETCDGADLDGKTCATEGFDGGGTLSCNGSCSAFVTAQCLECTNDTHCADTPAPPACAMAAHPGKKAAGAGGGGPGECASGFCTDGVCCGDACGGACKSCAVAGSEGTCTNLGSGTDPANECAGALSCNGAGACELPEGDPCSGNSACGSGFCVDGVCCADACAGLCLACSAAKTGGANGTCAPVAAGTDPDTECNGGTPNCDGVSPTPACQ